MNLFPRTILVSCNLDQKQSVTLGGMTFAIVPNRHNYESNARETNPVCAEVIQAGEGVPLEPGELILLHHNAINDGIWQVDGRHVIPFDRWVLATVDSEGHLTAMPNNIIAERVPKPETVGEYAAPQTSQVFYADRVITDDGVMLGIRKWGDYEVCYNWNGEVRRKVVLWKEDVVCVITDNPRTVQEAGNENYLMALKLFGK